MKHSFISKVSYDRDYQCIGNSYPHILEKEPEESCACTISKQVQTSIT